MKPKEPATRPQNDLFHMELENLIEETGSGDPWDALDRLLARPDAAFEGRQPASAIETVAR